MNPAHVRILDIIGDGELPARDIRTAFNERIRSDEKITTGAFGIILTEMTVAGLIVQRDDVLPNTSVQAKFYRKPGVIAPIPCLWSVRQKVPEIVVVGRLLTEHPPSVIVVALTPEDALAKYNRLTFGTEEAPKQSDLLPVDLDAVTPVSVLL